MRARRGIVHLDRSPIRRQIAVHLEPLSLEAHFETVYTKHQRAGTDFIGGAREAFRWRVCRPLNRLGSYVRLRLKALKAWLRRATAARPPHVTDDFRFDDPHWKGRPCQELVAEYLDRLDEIVTDSERRFGAETEQ